MKEYDFKIWEKLEKEYSPNNEIPFSQITPGSHKNRQWLCENHKHPFISSPAGRFRGQNCHYCSNNKVLEGFNDLSTKNPEILKEWDYDKNDIKPNEVQPKSNKKVWWICKLKHSYEQKIDKHTKGQNCPYCAGRKVLKGFNNINDEKLIREWDKNRNVKSIVEYTSGSNYNAYWSCENNHSFRASIVNRVLRKDGCPYCSGRKVSEGFNDLKSQYPELLKEWNFKKNTHINPETTNYKTTKKSWFNCLKCQHEWITPIYNRTILKTGCPKCAYSITTSKGEEELADFINNIRQDLKIKRNDRKLIKPWEIDIVIPELRIGIEFNGDYWHSEEIIQKSKRMSAEKYHTTKRNKVNIQGYVLLTVWENDWTNNNTQIKRSIEQVLNEIKAHGGIINEKIPDILTKVESDIL